MLQLKIINGEHHIFQSDLSRSSRVSVSIENERDQNFEIKLNHRINPITVPIITLYSDDLFKRFIPLGNGDIIRYQIIKIVIEQLGVQKYFPILRVGSINLRNGPANGIFEDLVLFNQSGVAGFNYLTQLSQMYSNCLPLNVVSKYSLKSEVFDRISPYNLQMFFIVIPLVGMWDIELHNILLRVTGSGAEGLTLVHVDFGDVPVTQNGRKRQIIINPMLLDLLNQKIHTDVIKFIDELPDTFIQMVNETIAGKQNFGLVWRKLWAEGKNIEITIRKMKELAPKCSTFRQFFEQLSL